MRKIKLYIATSLNGKIATADGSVQWLETIANPDKIEYGYQEFCDSIDTTIQGFSTYQQLISWDIPFPYSDKKNYVLTRKQNLQTAEYVEFISSNHKEFIQSLKQEDGKDIFLIGGGQVNTLLLNENLIDEIIVFIMPIILSKGIEIFELLPQQKLLELIETKTYSTGVVEIKYKIV